MYNQFSNAFPSRWNSNEATVGFGPCTLHAPGVNEPVGPNANSVSTGSSFASPIAAAHLNCYWTNNPTLSPQQVVANFESDCFSGVVLQDTPFATFDITVSGPNLDFTPRTTTRPTMVLDSTSVSSCSCS